MTRTVLARMANGKMEEVDAGDLSFESGEKVMVDSEKGPVLGKVLYSPREREEGTAQKPLRKVLRKATSEDQEQLERNLRLEKDAHEFCVQKIKEKNLNMKLVKTEVFPDRSKILFYFTADKRIDFRDLVKDLASQFRLRIEMRQIGVRDEAKMICGIGSCGRQLCCSQFMNRFELVSVRMAKEQNLALNPAKISGICGRLMCCLAYEYPTYMELKKNLPKVGKRVVTRSGKGKVIRQNVLNQTVTVELEEGGEITINGSEF